MDTNKNPKVISINHTRKKKETLEITDEETILILNGEVIHLEEFIITGKETNDNIFSLTSGCSIETSLLYKEILDITLREEIEKRLSKQ